MLQQHSDHMKLVAPSALLLTSAILAILFRARVTCAQTQKWSYMTGSYVASSGILGPDGTLYIGSDDNNVYAFQTEGASAGTQMWNYTTGSSVYSSGILGPDGTLYIGSNDNNF